MQAVYPSLSALDSVDRIAEEFVEARRRDCDSVSEEGVEEEEAVVLLGGVVNQPWGKSGESCVCACGEGMPTGTRRTRVDVMLIIFPFERRKRPVADQRLLRKFVPYSSISTSVIDRGKRFRPFEPTSTTARSVITSIQHSFRERPQCVLKDRKMDRFLLTITLAKYLMQRVHQHYILQ